jgi:thiol:disulfide interchange protein
MTGSIPLLFLTSLALAGPLANFDRDSTQKPEVTLTHQTLAGGVVRLTASYVVPEKMHQTLQPDYFDLEVTGLPSGWTAGATVYPPNPETVLGLPSWSGTFEVVRDLTPPEPGVALPVVSVSAKWQICFDDGVCLPPGRSTFVLGGQFDWWLALSLAFLGGMILNFMPCVLPVLALKLMGKPGRLSALATAAGIETGLLALGFVTLALQAGGNAAGWGFQFQSPWFGGPLVVVLVALALEWWGVWTLPVFSVSRKGTMSGKKHSWVDSYFAGLLTVALATPCTAPFLGTALGLTLGAPALAVVAVFATIGLGLALPYIVVAAVPGASNWVPKPGAWMAWVPRIGGAALLATALWLGSVVWQQLAPPEAQTAVTRPAGWEPFTTSAVRDASESEAPVLVEFTAAWCLTCRVNEAGALSSPEFKEAVKSSGARLFWGDFTVPDAAITDWLRSYGRAGVPFTLVLRKGQAPLVLSELLTTEALVSALKGPR